jgi:hypothetical protein
MNSGGAEPNLNPQRAIRSVESHVLHIGMAKEAVVIAQYHAALEQLGLTSIAGVKSFQGELVKKHGVRRDIFRIPTPVGDGRNVVLFLKRTWLPYKKDGLSSLASRGQVWSIARQEWENSQAMARAGLQPAALVAYGEEKGLLWEHFSFIITEAAEGDETLGQFIRRSRDGKERRLVIDVLAREIRRLHDAGLATPDLFARHIFLGWHNGRPRFCFIDIARLDHKRPITETLRARDLAALNLTAPLRFVSLRERLRFLRVYAGGKNAQLRARVVRRVQTLLRTRRKFSDYAASDKSAAQAQVN